MLGPAFLQLPGVKSVAVNLLLNSAMVILEASGATGPRDVIEAIDDAGTERQPSHTFQSRMQSPHFDAQQLAFQHRVRVSTTASLQPRCCVTALACMLEQQAPLPGSLCRVISRIVCRQHHQPIMQSVVNCVSCRLHSNTV